MTSNPPSITKFVLFKAPKTTKPPQEPYVAYYATQGSAREQSRTVTRGVDCLTINSISPSRPLTLDTQPSMRKIQNFRISSLASQAPSPSNSQLEEKDIRRLQTRGSIGVSDSQNAISNRVIPSSIGFRTKLEKKEGDNDIKKEEVWRPMTRQQQPNQKENSIKPTSEKRIIIKTLPSQRERLSDDDKKKISMYFRYKIFSISKIIEDKARGTLQVLIKNENVLMDDIWKTLKTLASLKRKYKCRDVVNYNRKLRETMKELFPLVSPKLEKRSATISLDDESPTKGPTKKPKSPDNTKASSLGEFIMRRKEAPATKAFIIIGGYPDLKRALEERGWIENPDPASKDFNLKWCSKLDIKYDTLKPNQYVNHFDKNTALTTKVGLTRSMRNLVWFDNEDIDQFFPRCYDLNDAPEFDDFLQDFKFEQAIATLRLAKNKTKGMNIQDYNLYKLRLCLALNVCERRLRPFETLLYDMMKNEVSIFTQEEWELMNIQDLDSNIMNDAKYTKILTSLKRRYGFEQKQTIVPENEESLFIQAQANLARLEKFFPQVALNQGKNIWIVKPAGLSRGRGICCHNSLPNILDHIQIKESEWVVQKYIENPLIIKKRKFDIRQWVLVTDWSPLTVWFYDECYIRFTAQDFNPEDLTNKFAHLTNNAIGKNASNFETSEIEGNMWDSKEFETYLKKLTGRNIFETIIKPQMKHIIVKSLLSGQDMLDARKNSFELYGYDFMVDDNYKVWVLEINSSPSMDYSTSITERLVRSVMTDCVKVIVDHGMAKGENKRNADTGNFECIYAGKGL